MVDKTKQKTDEKKESGKVCAENEETDEQGNWSEDQRKKSYYYDDAHGYEVYNPEEEEED